VVIVCLKSGKLIFISIDQKKWHCEISNSFRYRWKNYTRVLQPAQLWRTLFKLYIILIEQLIEYLTLHANFSEIKAFILKPYYIFYILGFLFRINYPHNTWISVGRLMYVLKSLGYVSLSQASTGRPKDTQRTSWFIIAVIGRL